MGNIKRYIKVNVILDIMRKLYLTVVYDKMQKCMCKQYICGNNVQTIYMFLLTGIEYFLRQKYMSLIIDIEVLHMTYQYFG